MVTKSIFNFGQKLERRVISNSPLQRFVWDFHSFTTVYNEPFGHVNITSPSGQGFVPDATIKPVRTFELSFAGMAIFEDGGLNTRKDLNFNSLYAFYKEHGTHKRFIYEHPVYGDIVVRFAKAIPLPKKIKNGEGSLQTFNITLIEVITTDYIFSPNEDFTGDLNFPCGFYDVELDVAEDTLVAPLGNNYEMTFKRARKPLTTFKLTISGLKYVTNPDGTLNLFLDSKQNMALLEVFYLKYRLKNKFKFSYLGEEYDVRFKRPLEIPTVEGNTGVLADLDIELIETPYDTVPKLFSTPTEGLTFTSWGYTSVYKFDPFSYARDAEKTNTVDTYVSFCLLTITDAMLLNGVTTKDHAALFVVLQALNPNLTLESYVKVNATSTFSCKLLNENVSPVVVEYANVSYATVVNRLRDFALFGNSDVEDFLRLLAEEHPIGEAEILQFEANKKLKGAP